jgi:hypothetical protein
MPRKSCKKKRQALLQKSEAVALIQHGDMTPLEAPFAALEDDEEILSLRDEGVFEQARDPSCALILATETINELNQFDDRLPLLGLRCLPGRILAI